MDSKPVPVEALDRLNMWLAAGGGWTCSLLSHFECELVLGRVLSGPVVARCGASGGGRWASGTAAEIVLRDCGESVQGDFRSKVGKTA